MPKTRSMRSRSRSRGRMGGRMGGRTKTRSSRAGKRHSMSLRKMRGGHPPKSYTGYFESYPAFISSGYTLPSGGNILPGQTY